MKRGRKALETLNKVSPVAIQTAKKVRGSCFAAGLFLLLQQEKIYKHNRKEKREKQQARIYKKRGGNKGMQKRDIFEELARCAGCHYISDLRSPLYNHYAKEAFREHFIPEDYSLKELSALYRYLYNKKKFFESHAEAREAFGLEEENASKNSGGVKPPLKGALRKKMRKEEKKDNESIQSKRKNGFVSCG